MNKQTDYPASRLQLLIYCIVLVGFFIIFIFTLFKPCYELKIGNKIIGYYNNYEDFINLYESFPKETMIGALSKYISTPNKQFQPMNANFGILPELGEKIKDKKIKYEKIADRALEYLNNFLKQ